MRRIEDLRGERREVTEGGRTIIREPDRTIIVEGGRTIIRHNEIDRFRYGAQDVRMERRGDENITVVVRPKRHLRHLLRSYLDYYNETRTHLSLDKHAPLSRANVIVSFEARSVMRAVRRQRF